MRVLTYAILGVLADKNLTGYDIANLFKGDLGEFWSTTHSRIYPELKKLTDESLISFETVIQGSIMEKKLYKITEKGKTVLHHWLTTQAPPPETSKDEFVLKTFFSHFLTIDEKVNLFQEQLNKRTENLSNLLSRLNKFQREIHGNLLINSPECGNYLAVKRAIGREKAYIEWLEESLTIFNQSTDA